MKKIKEYDEVGRVNINCDCGCSSLTIEQWQGENGPEEIFIAHKISSFYALQQPGWTKFKEAIKIIWCILRGKEYYFYEIVLTTKDQISKFKKAVALLDENIFEY